MPQTYTGTHYQEFDPRVAMAIYNAAHTLQILAVMQHFVSNIVYSIHKKANFLTANCKKNNGWQKYLQRQLLNHILAILRDTFIITIINKRVSYMYNRKPMSFWCVLNYAPKEQ